MAIVLCICCVAGTPNAVLRTLSAEGRALPDPHPCTPAHSKKHAATWLFGGPCACRSAIVCCLAPTSYQHSSPSCLTADD
jgi:hypothetical protein